MTSTWQSDDGRIRLMCGDSLEILPTLPALSADLILTDPPYSETTHKGARTLSNLDSRPVDFAFFTVDDLHRSLSECGRLCKRWVVATVDWRHALSLETDPPDDLLFVRLGVWIKPNGAPQFTGDRPATGWEAVVFLHRRGVRLRWNGGGHHSVFVENIIQKGNHPTEKPLRLICRFVDLFSGRQDLVLDPFCGSGTTGVACIQTGRRFIGIEREPAYFDIARKRLSDALQQTSLPLWEEETPLGECEPGLFDLEVV